MVAWYWLLVCLSVGTIFGYFLCALMVISKKADEDMNEIYLKETGRWNHNEPWFRPDEKPEL